MKSFYAIFLDKNELKRKKNEMKWKRCNATGKYFIKQ